MNFDLPRAWNKNVPCIILTLCILLLWSCSGSSPGDSDESGALNVTFTYRGSAAGFKTQASNLDCDQTGIAEIEAKIFDEYKNQIGKGGPWSCDSGKGTVPDVKAGRQRTVVVRGFDANKNIIFRGEKTGIEVLANKVNNTGDIKCTDFRPHKLTPENQSLSKIGAIHFTWEAIDGAAEYRILISETSDMRQVFFEDKTKKTEYKYEELLSPQKTYHWQVVAIDGQGIEGIGGQSGSFVTMFFSSVATGNDHTLAIKPDGTLWSWGGNSYGQLGLGEDCDCIERDWPSQVGTDTDWAHVAAGPAYSVALKSDGTLWSWGENGSNVLGSGSNASMIHAPTRIGSDKDWAYVAAGDYHVAAIKTNGELWAWGANKYGQLGRGDTDAQSRPTYMDSTGWVHVAAGSYHTLGVNTNSQLLAWGNNSKGQLGLNGATDRTRPEQVDSARDWAYVSTNALHTVALKTTGELWAWGNNDSGQLGQDNFQSAAHPVQVGSDKDWIQAVAAANSTLALKAGGELWAWGANEFGQLGLGDTKVRTVTDKISDGPWTFVNGRGYHAAAIDKDGEIWCWGKNAFGEVGNGALDKRKRPARVGTDTDWGAIGQGYGNSAAFATKTNGELWVWGRNHYEQLGIGEAGQQQSPVRLGDDVGWTLVTNGSAFTLVIKEIEAGKGGTLWTWGNGSNTPEQVGNDEAWVSVYAGKSFAVGIKEKGAEKKRTLWAWGKNDHGQLGLGDAEKDKSIPNPVQVGTDATWKTVVAGAYHTVALKSNGTLWTWGENYHGQLGDGGNTDKSLPTRVGAAENWKFIVAGDYHTLAIKDDGTLWTWGYNEFGQLGVGDQTDRKVPTKVETQGSAQWHHVAAGYGFTVAIKDDGTLWAWGGNKYGQLGDESLGTGVTARTAQIGTDTGWVSVGASGSYAFALKNDGTFLSWGDNTYGQLGDGQAWQLTPYQVSFD